MNGGEVKFTFKGDDNDLTKKTNGLTSKLGGVGKTIGGAFVKGAVVAGGALTGLVGASVKMYADMEQNVGGVETLFKNSANTVIANAKKAYQTAGMSANTYMETVTSFSASLLQSVGGDTAKAAKVADMAIIDMSDNANKMGTSMEAIQNAYQGFAKQNYTMLDNLKLGYGGTKTEMERLLADASKISGIKYDINNLNDVYQAIHVIQGELGITGTTAKEASETISGSVTSAKSAFENFLSGAGSIDAVVDSFVVAGNNIGKAVIQMAPKIISGIVQLINGLIPQMVPMIKKLLPVVIQGVMSLIQGLVSALPTILNALMAILPQTVSMITRMLPQILQALIKGAILIVNALATQLPVLIPQIIDAILAMIPILIDNLPLFIQAGYKLIIGLLSGIIQSIPRVLAYIPKIVKSIVNYFKSLPGTLWNIAKNAVTQLGKAFVNNASSIVSKVKNLGSKVVNGIKNILKPSTLLSVGKNLITGLWNGIANAKDWVISKIKGLGSTIIKSIKSIFGVKSPSRVMFAIGGYLDQGFINGIMSMQNDIDKAVTGTFDLSPSLYGTASNHFSPNVNVTVVNNQKQDRLGQFVNDVKTFAGGAKNDHNYGTGV